MGHQREESVSIFLSPPSSRRRAWSRYSGRTFYLFVAPWLIGFILLTAGPMVYALIISLTDFDGLSPRWHWVGIANYQAMFQDSDMWYSLGRSLLYGAIVVPLGVAGSLGLALLLNRRFRAVDLFRTAFFAPYLVPVVATAIVWRLILDRDAGVINAILERIGLPAVTWLVDPTAFYALVIIALWRLGGGMVIMLAGLQGIPVELEEAAVVDGAGSWDKFRHIILPILSPVIFFQVVTSVIGALQIVVEPLLLAETDTMASITAVPRGNYLYMVNVYQQFFANQRFGYGSAMLWIFFLVILAITLLVLRSSAFWVYYEVDRGN
jgi:multiple sugar transport system permease protein